MMTAAKQDGIYIPIGVLGTIAAALLIQGIFALIWGAHVDARIKVIEDQQVVQDRKIESLTEKGSNNLGIVQERQNVSTKRIDHLEKMLNQHILDAKRSGIGQTPP